jgi:hypothetical protein
MQYDNGERVAMKNKIVFDEGTLRRVLARMGIKMNVLESEYQVLFEMDKVSDKDNHAWYIDMMRV